MSQQQRPVHCNSTLSEELEELKKQYSKFDKSRGYTDHEIQNMLYIQNRISDIKMEQENRKNG